MSEGKSAEELEKESSNAASQAAGKESVKTPEELKAEADAAAAGGNQEPVDAEKTSRAQQRIQELIGKQKRLETKVARYESGKADTTKLSDDEKEEVEKVQSAARKAGMVSSEDLSEEAKAELKEVEEQLELQLQHCEKTLPGFDRKEVLEYAQKNGITNPIGAWKQLQYDKAVLKNSKPDAPNVATKPGGTAGTGTKEDKPNPDAKEVHFADGSLTKSLEEKIRKSAAA